MTRFFYRSSSLRIVLGLLGVCLLALVITGASIYSRMSYLWALLLVGSWAWTALALRGVRVERRARIERAQVGQIFEELFEIRNDSRLPRLWLEVRDRSGLPGSRGSRVLTLMEGRRRQSYVVRTRLVHRGVFSLGPTELASGDLFGIFRVRRVVSSDASLLVYPMMSEVTSFPNPPGLLPGGEALRRRTHQVTANASGVRDYAPGDSLSRIHWLSTARRERLMVKEFELDPMAEVWIFLDADQKVHAELPYSPPTQVADALWHPTAKIDLPPSTEEYAVSIAASLARYFLRRGRAVGLLSHSQSGAQGPDLLPPDRGGRQLAKMLEALAISRARGDLSISALVTAQAQHLPRGSTVILITPSVSEEVALAVDVLLRRGVRPVAVLLDAASFGGSSGTEALAVSCLALGVPVRRVPNGVDLTTALATDMI
jgi:uncharacterized protein (DUF58 family)